MKKRIIYALLLGVILSLIFYALRGPNVSNELKRLILPELETATGKKFIAEKMSINLIPLFIEIKNVKAFDDQGNRFFAVKRVKGYIGLSGLLKKEIIIKRLAIKEPQIDTGREDSEKIIDNVKQYLAKETKMPFKIVVKSIDVSNSTVSLKDKDIQVSAEGLSSEILLSNTPRVRISSKEISFVKKGFPEYNAMLETAFILKEDRIDLKMLNLFHNNSRMNSSGIFDIKRLGGEFRAEIDLFVESIKKIFDLKGAGDGRISGRGFIKFDDLKTGINKIFLDLRLKGDIYIETLMELLEVKETLKGYLNFEGQISGYLNNLQGSAKAKIKSGNLFNVEVDNLNCNISYKEGIMKFSNGSASLYKGTALVEAMITLPVVDYYSFKVKVKDASSKGLFKLIKWDPHIPEGRVTGEIESSGSEFNPHGKFSYISAPKGRDILDRIKEINGEFRMTGNEIYLSDMFISTDRSNLLTTGRVDLQNNELFFSGNGATSDVNELSSPYFTALSGPGKFNLTVSGVFEDPTLDLRFISNNMVFFTSEMGISDVLENRTLKLDAAEGAMTYRKNLLDVKNILVRSNKEEYKAVGKVYFRKAQELFELKEPDYDLNISAKNIDIKALSDMFQEKPIFSGNLSTDFRLYGRSDDIRVSGNFRTNNFELQSSEFGVIGLDYMDGRISYSKREFSFDDLNIKKGASTLNANGKISLDKRFSFTAGSRQIKVVDLIPHKIKLEDSQLEFIKTISLTDTRVKGEGTFSNPNIEIKSNLTGGIYRGAPLGKGMIKGILSNRHADIIAAILDGKLSIEGRAELIEDLPWSAVIELQPARYDFIITRFLKDIPEDLLLSLSGSIKAHGDKNRINATAKINRAHLSLYGIGFANSADIIASLQDRKLSIDSLSMKGEATEFNLSGSINIGRNYDLLFEGSSLLAPLKAVSRTIDTIRGNASFVFSVAGDWDRPRISGGIDVSNGFLGFKDITHRLTAVSAYIYVQDDRIVIEQADGKISGGDINISGIAYLDGFSIKRFFLESRLNDITTSVSKDFWITFGGKLYYRGTMESQILLGDIDLKKAKYSERIEWKTWLLKARQKEKPKVEMTKLDKTNLNIRVSGENMLIDNNVARASMKMDILLRGTVSQPIALGKVDTNEGIVYFRNNEFKVLKASVDFSDPNQINPYFNIAAETSVRNYNIKLNLDGYIDQFNLSLSSTPALDEIDIFSLLTVGQIGRHLKGLEGGIGAGEATSFVTGKLQDVFEERLKTITGFDRVQIDPHVSQSVGTVMPRVTVSKRLLGDKLYVTYSTAVGAGEEQVLKMEYTLGKNASLVGIRDEKGGIGGDIKFRFEFK